MALSTAQLVTLLAPALEGDARLTVALEHAASVLSPAAYGARWAEACVLYAAHGLTRSATDVDPRVTGPLSGVSAGATSESYGLGGAQAVIASASDADLSSTAYGQRFLALQKGRAAARVGVIRL